MPQIVQGEPLDTFAGTIQARHDIKGPGSESYKAFQRSDQQTYLISTGVIDCAILAVVRPNVVINGPVGELNVDGHRGPCPRGMAHFNRNGGPDLEGIKKLIGSVRGEQGVASQLEVTIVYHTGSRFNYQRGDLADLVEQAEPGVTTITMRTYGVDAPKVLKVGFGSRGGAPVERGSLPEISVYLAPDGTVTGSS
jgi:hypothetical protein